MHVTQLRQWTGLSQEEFAQILKISRSFLAMSERAAGFPKSKRYIQFQTFAKELEQIKSKEVTLPEIPTVVFDEHLQEIETELKRRHTQLKKIRNALSEMKRIHIESFDILDRVSRFRETHTSPQRIMDILLDRIKLNQEKRILENHPGEQMAYEKKILLLEREIEGLEILKANWSAQAK